MLAVKGNQPTLHDGIVEFFLDQMEDDFARVKVSRHETKEQGTAGTSTGRTTCATCRTTCPIEPVGRA